MGAADQKQLFLRMRNFFPRDSRGVRQCVCTCVCVCVCVCGGVHVRVHVVCVHTRTRV